jgi:hypothetical protein
MKVSTSLLAVALLAAPGALRAQDPAAKAPEVSPAAAAAAAAPAPATPPMVMYEKVNIVVDGKAEAAGNIQFSLEMVGRDAKVASVNILAKEKDKKIVEQIQREVSIALGSEFKVKASGREVRITKANKKSPNLAVVIKQLQLPGVSVRVEKG